MGQGSADAPERAPREAAVALASPAGRQLAAELRRIKQQSGLSFARLEARTNYSRASLERYVNGKLFPSRNAVEDIAQACGTDPGPLLELWDDALETGLRPQQTPPPVSTVPEPGPTASPAEPAGRERGPLRTRRRVLLLTGAGLAFLLSLGLAFPPFALTSAPPAPTTGCRDYTADIRAVAVGKVCWHAAKATVSGYVESPKDTGRALAQLCLSHHPNVCSQTIDLAIAKPGTTARYHRTVALPAGHGAWVRACAKGLCTQWD